MEILDWLVLIFLIGVATGIVCACNKEKIMLWWYDLKDIMESDSKKKKKKGKKKNGKRFLR